MNNLELQKTAVVPFVEELSDLELEAISGGGNNNLVNAEINNNNVEVLKNVNVAVNALGKSILQQKN